MPSSENLLRKAARAAKKRQKRWISRLFLSTGNVPAVALSNFDDDGPATALEEGARVKEYGLMFMLCQREQRTRGSELRNRF
jgi:hypothetical protein